MIQEDTTERSAEILRLALPLMSKHAPGFQPVNYAIWYEYVHGGNGALKEEVDQAIKGEERLTWNRTQALYQRHLIDGPEQAFMRARADLINLLGKMQGSVREASTDTGEFSQMLGAFGDQLAKAGSVVEMKASVESMIHEVQRVSGSLQALDGDLVSSRGEIQRLSDALAKMREEADTDALTGLRNRRAFDRELARVSSGPEAIPQMSLLIVDIDHFKRVNDTCGHLFGDRVLQGVAKAIAATVKGRDMAARFGGEEFAVLLPGTDATGAVCVAEQIREAVSGIRIRRAQSEQTIASVTVSVGVAERADLTEPVDAWFDRADKALYKAKNNGRNRVERAG